MPDGAVGWVIKFLQTELEALDARRNGRWWHLRSRPLSMRRGSGMAGWWPRRVAGAWRACLNAKNYQTIPSRKEALDIQATVLAALGALLA
jgi:hypothetical protein